MVCGIGECEIRGEKRKDEKGSVGCDVRRVTRDGGC